MKNRGKIDDTPQPFNRFLRSIPRWKAIKNSLVDFELSFPGIPIIYPENLEKPENSQKLSGKTDDTPQPFNVFLRSIPRWKAIKNSLPERFITFPEIRNVFPDN